MCFYKQYVSNLKTINSIDEVYFTSLEKLKKRAELRIAVIDDEGFDKNSLEKFGFTNIDIKESYGSLSDYKQYNLILCDVDGIGTNADPKKQGLAIAKELSDIYYPATVVAIYSGKELSKYEYENIPNVEVIRKNISFAELAERIMQVSEILWRPKEIWAAIEGKLRKDRITNKDLAVFEDAFVRAYTSKSSSIIWKSTETSQSNNDKLKDVLTIVSSLLTMWAAIQK